MPMNQTMTMEEARADFHSAYSDAVAAENTEAVETAFASYAENVCRILQGEAEAMSSSERLDDAILAARGVRTLTTNETKYYTALTAAMRQSSAAAVQSALENLDAVMPEETIDQVMTDIQTDFPLLDAVDFVNTSYLSKWLYNAKGVQTATWGAIGSEIAGELGGAFRMLSATQCKLTCYMAISNDYLDLGPRWLDRYVRAVMEEAIGVSLETAIVDGQGNADGAACPIGMTRDLDKGTTAEATGLTTYERKEAIAVTQLDPTAYGEILAAISKTPTGRTRKVNRALLVCNPTDYFKKIMPATTFLTPNGSYVNNVLPYPTDVVQSVGCPEGYAVVGIAEQYLALLGVGSKRGTITYDDSAQFLQDNRVYKGRFLGNGRPKDNMSFVLLDISNLQAAAFKVEQVSAAKTA